MMIALSLLSDVTLTYVSAAPPILKVVCLLSGSYLSAEQLSISARLYIISVLSMLYLVFRC